MKDLNTYVVQCKQDLNLLGIPYGNVHRWEINTRAKSRWGLCKYLKGGDFVISIAQMLLEDGVDEQALKDTIVHELLHTVPRQDENICGKLGTAVPTSHFCLR